MKNINSPIQLLNTNRQQPILITRFCDIILQQNIMEFRDRKKIFISNINSKLGYHLVQTLRNDHQLLENYNLIIGSRDKRSGLNQLHPSVHAVINFQKNPNLLAKSILECNLIILDIRQASQQSEFILKLLSQKSLPCSTPFQSCRLVLAIGSHMTWAHEKLSISKFQSSQKQKQSAIAKFIHYFPQKEKKISKQDRNRRIPHHLWSKEREMQKIIEELNENELAQNSNAQQKGRKIRAAVLTAGLFYGKDICSKEIQDFVSRTFCVQSDVSVYGDGRNILPTVHIDDFCQDLLAVLTILERPDQKYSNYYISVDKQSSTQIQIVESMLKTSGFIKKIQRQKLSYLTRQQAHYSQSIPLQLSSFSSLSNSYSSRCPSLLAYFSQPQTQSQFFHYFSFVPVHYVLYSQQFQQHFFDEMVADLGTVIQVFREKDIVEEIRAKECDREREGIAKDGKESKDGKEEIDIHYVGRVIEQKYLKMHQVENYILILQNMLLDTNIVKQYQLKKFQIEDAEKLLSHKFQKYKTLPNRDPLNQSKKQLVHVSQQQQTQLQFLKPKTLTANPTCTLSLEEPLEPKKIQVQKFHKKLDQYLFDNVVCYISQAFIDKNGEMRQNMGQRKAKGNGKKKENKENLKNFIDNLKHIYKRQLEISE